jgi:hypothetical protein
MSALTSGLAIVASMGHKLHATLHITNNNGAIVSMTFPKLGEQ